MLEYWNKDTTGVFFPVEMFMAKVVVVILSYTQNSAESPFCLANLGFCVPYTRNSPFNFGWIFFNVTRPNSAEPLAFDLSFA